MKQSQHYSIVTAIYTVGSILASDTFGAYLLAAFAVSCGIAYVFFTVKEDIITNS
jgi:hypothetical protein